MTDSQVYDLINRWYILRKLHPEVVPPMWSECYLERTRLMECERWKFWVLEHGTYGDKIYMSAEDLRAMVEKGERDVKKPIVREHGQVLDKSSEIHRAG